MNTIDTTNWSIERVDEYNAKNKQAIEIGFMPKAKPSPRAIAEKARHQKYEMTKQSLHKLRAFIKQFFDNRCNYGSARWDESGRRNYIEVYLNHLKGSRAGFSVHLHLSTFQRDYKGNPRSRTLQVPFEKDGYSFSEEKVEKKLEKYVSDLFEQSKTEHQKKEAAKASKELISEEMVKQIEDYYSDLKRPATYGEDEIKAVFKSNGFCSEQKPVVTVEVKRFYSVIDTYVCRAEDVLFFASNRRKLRDELKHYQDIISKLKKEYKELEKPFEVQF